MAIEINPDTARHLPIYRIDFSHRKGKAKHDQIVSLVTEMLMLQKEYMEAERTLDDRRHTLARQIGDTDHALDQAIYKLYDLT